MLYFSSIFNIKIVSIVIAIFVSGLIINAQSKFYSKIVLPDIFKEADVLTIQDGIVNLVNNKNKQIWRYRIHDSVTILNFKVDASILQKVYESAFGDNGVTYNKAIKMYAANDVSDPSKIGRCYVHDNKMYTIVEAYEIKALPRNLPGQKYNPQKDFMLAPFHVLLEITDSQKVSCRPIRGINETLGYYLNGEIDFFKDKQTWVFSIAKPMVSDAEPNYFLGKWKEVGNELLFDGFCKAQVSTYHQKSGLAYGLLDFIYKKPFLMPYASATLYNLATDSVIQLTSEQSDSRNYGGVEKNEVFDINFSICDFHVDSIQLKGITRKKDVFWMNVYSRVNYRLISQTKLDLYTLKDLARFPFFSDTGWLVFVPKVLYGSAPTLVIQ